jgi:hypothetical protein
MIRTPPPSKKLNKRRKKQKGSPKKKGKKNHSFSSQKETVSCTCVFFCAAASVCVLTQGFLSDSSFSTRRRDWKGTRDVPGVLDLVVVVVGGGGRGRGMWLFMCLEMTSFRDVGPKNNLSCYCFFFFPTPPPTRDESCYVFRFEL